MAAAMGADERVRGLLMFYKANRTGRYAGQLVQIQNLPRNYLDTLSYARELVRSRNLDMVRMMYGNVPDTLSQLIRTAFIPEPGTHFLVADFSAIEARVIAWLAGEQWVLDVFRTHGKIYEAAASQMFGVPMEKIIHGNPEYELRQKGKVATLALGYGGGAKALIKMGALEKGLTEEELPDIVDKWRTANPRIVRLWRELEAAAITCVTTCQPQQVHGMIFAREGDPSTGQDFLTVALPVGRKLFYVRPSIRPGKFDKPALYYMGVAQDGGKSKKWGHISTWGGKIAENLTQAIARDCLTEILLRLETLGYKTVFHVHDEVIIEAPTNELAPVLATMAEPMVWAPGLPLKGAGFTTDEFYRKE
jgi:DNA polymerase